MKVRDCLDLTRDCDCIMYRTNSPFEDEEDMLFGYASYKAGDNELTSEDGDNYSLNDEIYKYDWVRNDLIVWIRSEWSSGK